MVDKRWMLGQGSKASGQQRANRALSALEGIGYLGIRKIVHVAEGKGDPLAIGERPNRLANASTSPDLVFHRSGHIVAD
jgi:hypothetical protein